MRWRGSRSIRGMVCIGIVAMQEMAFQHEVLMELRCLLSPIVIQRRRILLPRIPVVSRILSPTNSGMYVEFCCVFINLLVSEPFAGTKLSSQHVHRNMRMAKYVTRPTTSAFSRNASAKPYSDPYLNPTFPALFLSLSPTTNRRIPSSTGQRVSHGGSRSYGTPPFPRTRHVEVRRSSVGDGMWHRPHPLVLGIAQTIH